MTSPIRKLWIFKSSFYLIAIIFALYAENVAATTVNVLLESTVSGSTPITGSVAGLLPSSIGDNVGGVVAVASFSGSVLADATIDFEGIITLPSLFTAQYSFTDEQIVALTSDGVIHFTITPMADLGGEGFWTSTFSYDASPVPIPAAVWLFGSGLIGLIGIARRKKA